MLGKNGDLGLAKGMIEDREIWACANLLLRQHGEGAQAAAYLRADELLEAGEIEGHRTFKRILDRICALQAETAAGEVH